MKITNQYLEHLEVMKLLDLEIAGEFLLMAATLMHIKSKMLLPPTEEEEKPDEEVDPREELVAKLLEYKKFKEAGEILRERALLEERNFVPPLPVGKIASRVDLEPVTNLYDLMMAFKDVMAARPTEVEHEVDTEEITIEDRVHALVPGYVQHLFCVEEVVGVGSEK